MSFIDYIGFLGEAAETKSFAVLLVMTFCGGID